MRTHKNEKNQKINKSKKCPNKAKLYKNNIEFGLCWLTISGHRACPEVWLIYPVTFSWRKVIFPFARGYQF